jgi:hypothetical protein
MTMKKILISAVAASFCFYPVFSDDQVQEEQKEETPAVEEAPKKKRAKKPKRVIFNPMEAKRFAEICECPIFLLVTLEGSKESSRLVSNYFTKPDLQKEMIFPNGIFCKIAVPQKKIRARRGQNQKEMPIVPDFEMMKENVQNFIKMNAFGPQAKSFGTSESAYPQFVVLSSSGAFISSITPTPNGSTSLKELVSMAESAFKQANYEFEISNKLQKLIDKDTKTREKAAKRAARMSK